jgi:hyperosmotically inducible protein
MSFKNGYLAIALMGGLAVVGCSNTAAGAKKDTEINSEKAAAAAEKAKDEAKPKVEEAAADTKEAAKDAGTAVKDATRDATDSAKAAGETVDIKSALMADAAVDASHVDVDTYKDTKTVVLRGSVKTAAQVSKAGSIAAAKAPGYRIDNQLKVVPNP